MLSFFDGKKTYLAAIGFLGLAIHQAVNEVNYQGAFESVMLALGAFGMRSALQKASTNI